MPPSHLQTDLVRQLKNVCGAGGTVNQNGLEVQGDHRENVAAVLRERGFEVKGKGGGAL